MVTIRQRRLAALLLIVCTVGFSLSINGWQYSPVKWLLDIDIVTEDAFTAGDPYSEWVYSYCDGENQQVAVLRDGQLSGADGLKNLLLINPPRLCDLPLVDHPELAVWDEQLRYLQETTQNPDASARHVLRAALAIPLSSLYLKPLETWLLLEPSNATEYLDVVSTTSLDFSDGYMNFTAARRENFSTMIEVALNRVPNSDLNSQRLDRWLASDTLEDHLGTLITIALNTDIDAASRARLLASLNDVDDDQRAKVYNQLAASLAGEPLYAELLVRQLKKLPRKERPFAAKNILDQDVVSNEVVREILGEFDDVFYGDQAELNAFISIADKIKGRSESPRQLAATLKELGNTERRQAAIHLLSLDAAGSSDFTLSVLKQFDELHSISRPKVMDEILISLQFQREEIQEAALDAVRDEMDGAERREYLSKMLMYRNISDGVESRIKIALND